MLSPFLTDASGRQHWPVIILLSAYRLFNMSGCSSLQISDKKNPRKPGLRGFSFAVIYRS